MTCPRCQSRMFADRAYDRQRTIWLWACYACGNRLDDAIWFHQQMIKEETQAARHERLLRELQLAMAQSNEVTHDGG